ncbi:unnamed protein product [Tilletia controversa]|uniref:NAD(P)H-hydrate epimerase n=3 Tax=Tilletia TaxID=13289 RepID=A0A8X7SXG9_9BASI|nr:hypothetical protein CF336_g3020 [Tilletia laevis]KAE8201200.1 hypothetical protein CF328_g2742 [Tilletia controversa]KAE8263333.1 hypothetical protein A4X03_0g1768 [Tilletia caries]KAE8206290.1 hypothetical protein CF335_g2000 [Tilletia laevis]KAE8248657.1 hypothetical protein A4X06_0g3579 [Tilletia controversa]
MVTQSAPKVSYISAAVAAALDSELMDPTRGGFSIDQLMELAGLACAQAVFRSYPPEQHPWVLVACGPGNQGGDGLVAARHLLHFGYTPRVWYPKRGKTELFSRLVQQLYNLEVEFVDQEDFQDALENADVILDAIFGFSFKGEVREPFREPLELLKDESRMEFELRYKLPPIVSVDIPSAWDVDEGNVNNRSFTPQVLVSLTAPKLGAREFSGRHFLGGRFLPPAMAERYGILLPQAFIGGAAPADGRVPQFGLGTGSSSGSGRNAPAGSSEGVRPGSSSYNSRLQSSSATGTPQLGEASASSTGPRPSSYYTATPSTVAQILCDDSQIVEITGAEPIDLREVMPAGSSAPASSAGDEDVEREDASSARTTASAETASQTQEGQLGKSEISTTSSSSSSATALLHPTDEQSS